MTIVDSTAEIIKQHMTEKACVLWSGGKDSGVLLDMCRAIKQDIPVVYLRVPFLPAKNAFHNQHVLENRFHELHDGIPARIELRKGENGRVDFYETYSMEGWGLTVARGTERPEEGKPYVCGVDWLNRPKGQVEWPWTTMFAGHKSVDIDPLTGPIPLEVGVLVGPNQKKIVYPLRDWTEQDIVDYHLATNLPYDENRYNWKMETASDKHGNSDYFATCVNCLDPANGEFVNCPKYNTTINSMAAVAPWSSHSASYCHVSGS